MDICSHIGFSVNDVSSLHGSCMDTLESNCKLTGDYSMDELAYQATNILNIQDDAEVVSGSIPPQVKNECRHQNKTITSVGGAVEGEINDNADVITSEVSTNDDDAKCVISCSSSTSTLSNRVKPVSALKGSREKRGATPPKKLTVKWAPDVYDPLPAPSLHMVMNKPRKHGKKSSKSKQKSASKSSRGSSKVKEKKQVRKRSGTVSSSDMGLKYYEQKDELIRVSEIHKPSDINFRLGIPDLYCGGSFVNRYGSSLHLSSVTEAT
ncbi:hypothetical protein CTI12_AA405500 [Artemisia annua]|uniref:Uncharacterized protein n=1 Tax=Artemisia annua TaxID=35608 RepID=A0A2U1MA95_ARTAN|nr:hypothetical protein CTI12_AA405500 [Artemisia annua]